MKQRKRILLADASEEFRNLLREELEKANHFTVESLADGHEVLRNVRNSAPDLLLMDVVLFGLDGLSVLHQLHGAGCLPSTILISSVLSSRIVSEAYGLGSTPVLPKPFMPDFLLDQIYKLFQLPPKSMPPPPKGFFAKMSF